MNNEIKFIVKGRIPSKKNNQQILTGRGGHPFIMPSKKFKDWQNNAFIQLLHQKVPRQSKVCSMIELKVYFPDRRKADLTNKAESIMDMMVEYGVIEDDNWKCTGEVRLIPFYDKENPRCEIKLFLKEEVE